ncbi:MAG: hypothetical protein VZQ55_03145 [Ruminococcus sp.]|jgi:hypothetical protein|nr:hypothetical protein [Ruminococcus sp.]
MKKILISAVAVLVIAMSFASCYDPYAGIKDKSKIPATTGETTAKASTEAAKEKTLSDSKYKDSYEGLRDYMKDSGYIKTDDKNAITKMKADLIGAETGYKYTDGNKRVELYAFNLGKNSDTRDKVIKSVTDKGTFTLYSETIPAYLSDNGKYLMVYTDPAANNTNSAEYKNKAKAVKDFKAFKASAVAATEETSEKATEKATEKTTEKE